MHLELSDLPSNGLFIPNPVYLAPIFDSDLTSSQYFSGQQTDHGEINQAFYAADKRHVFHFAYTSFSRIAIWLTDMEFLQLFDCVPIEDSWESTWKDILDKYSQLERKSLTEFVLQRKKDDDDYNRKKVQKTKKDETGVIKYTHRPKFHKMVGIESGQLQLLRKKIKKEWRRTLPASMDFYSIRDKLNEIWSSPFLQTEMVELETEKSEIAEFLDEIEKMLPILYQETLKINTDKIALDILDVDEGIIEEIVRNLASRSVESKQRAENIKIFVKHLQSLIDINRMYDECKQDMLSFKNEIDAIWNGLRNKVSNTQNSMYQVFAPCVTWQVKNSEKVDYKFSVDLFEYDHHVFHVHRPSNIHYLDVELNKELRFPNYDAVLRLDHMIRYEFDNTLALERRNGALIDDYDEIFEYYEIYEHEVVTEMLKKHFPDIGFVPIAQKLCFYDYLTLTLVQTIANYFGLDMIQWMEIVREYAHHLYQEGSTNLKMILPAISDVDERLEHMEKLYSKYCYDEFKEIITIGEGSFGKVKKCLHPYKGLQTTPIGIVLPLVNISLENVIHDRDPITKEFSNKYTLDDAIMCFTGILQSIREIHAHGFIHRDLKPSKLVYFWSNFILLKQKNDYNRTIPLIADLGTCAKSDSNRITTNSCYGTLPYTAPEMIEQLAERKMNYTTKVDVYSAGVIFWELIHRQRPYDGLENYQIKEIVLRGNDHLPPKELQYDKNRCPQFVSTEFRKLKSFDFQEITFRMLNPEDKQSSSIMEGWKEVLIMARGIKKYEYENYCYKQL